MRLIHYCLIIFLVLVLFFSYKLTYVPRGITVDEAAFGYNASLIADTGRDENNRLLPVFVLSLDGRDWRQPVAQYSQVLMYKIFGSSLFNLKMVNVLYAAFSGVLIFLLGTIFLSKKFGLLGLTIFLSIPVILIHSHLALDNLSPIPFILLWLLGLMLFEKKKDWKFLLTSGLALGISFYAHKSMRSAVPIWTILTLINLGLFYVKNRKIWNFRNFKPVIIFLISILPFYAVAPILDYKYAGAVFGTQTISAKSIYEFVYFYISNFDLSFLFIKGDSILHHSTGMHGMFLLSSLPLFVYGIYRSFYDKNKFLIFLIVCFFAGPLMLGFIGSVHRASRMLFLVPLFSLISAYGIYKLMEYRENLIKGSVLIFCFVFIFNLFDFIKYYWFNYGQDTKHIFYSFEVENVYKKMSEISEKENLKPLFSEELINEKGDSASVDDFARSLYFTKIQTFNEKINLPEKTILISRKNNLKEEKIDSGNGNYYFYVNR